MLSALHAALEGEGPAPEWWLLSRICEDFGMPLVAGGAIDQPWAPSLAIMEMRTFAWAKRMLDEAKGDQELPDHPMIEIAATIRAEQVAAIMAARKEAAAGGKGKGKQR